MPDPFTRNAILIPVMTDSLRRTEKSGPIYNRDKIPGSVQ